ncbi:MAG: dTDP-4-dehydrorhamnose reductase [Candidatus Omnitrophota bacterium]|nr:MAG: dTDP-4-dehydrorhamnose reductase [Candidatus Omnitrophota bacterium]
MKILITGSSGMLGQALCAKLADRHEVIGIDIKEVAECKLQLADFFQLDITDRNLIIQKIEEVAPDIIIHCAAYTDVDGCESNPEKAQELNVATTATIAEGCKLTSSYMIYISTDFVFDGKKKSPYTEKDRPNPINIYGKTKLEGEDAVKDMLDKYLIIRTSWLFGKGGKNFVDIILNRAKKEKELKVVNDQIGCPTYAIDLAGAVASVISNQLPVISGRLLNITNSGSCTWYEFAREIFGLANISGVDIMPISSEELGRPARRPKMSVLDNTKFREISDRYLPPWRDALKRYLEERKNNK